MQWRSLTWSRIAALDPAVIRLLASATPSSLALTGSRVILKSVHTGRFHLPAWRAQRHAADLEGWEMIDLYYHHLYLVGCTSYHHRDVELWRVNVARLSSSYIRTLPRYMKVHVWLVQNVLNCTKGAKLRAGCIPGSQQRNRDQEEERSQVRQDGATCLSALAPSAAPACISILISGARLRYYRL